MHGVVLLMNHVHVFVRREIHLSLLQQFVTFMQKFTVKVFVQKSIFQNLDRCVE
jgi:hypothetical protein